MSNESTPPPRYGTRTNPRTGKPETYVLPEPVDLAKARKELADVLHGGGWFDDPLSPQPAPEPEPDPDPEPCLYIGTPDTWGMAIESIRRGK